MSDSVRPHRRQPTRLLCPWDSPGKNTEVGCHFLLQCKKVKSESEVAQSCPTQRRHGLQSTRLLHPCDFQARVLEWVASAFSEYWSGLQFPSLGDLSDPGIKSTSPALAGGFFTTDPPGKPHMYIYSHVYDSLFKEQNKAKLITIS